jgi:hypothetical protein
MNATAEQLHRAVVTVAYVNDPKPGKKNGSIKDDQGQYWSVWPNMLRQFEPGETYELDYEQNGAFRNIKAHRHIQPQLHSQSAPQQNGSRNGSVTTITARAIETVRAEPITVEQPKAQPQQNGAQWYRPTHPRDARRMFWTATLGHFIETGRVECTAQTLADASAEILAAYDAVLKHEGEGE